MAEAWNETEVRETVKKYFELLKRENCGEKICKTQAFRELHDQFPIRTTSSFEYKFQNVSAVLYEMKQNYLRGLKPKFNYQKLLRLIVLDQIDEMQLPDREPWEILRDKLKEIKRNEPIIVTGTKSGRFGLALERELGIPPNNSKNADFMGIELKTKGGKTLQTLFSRSPSHYGDYSCKEEFFNSYCYKKNGKRGLYTSFTSQQDSLGFTLTVKKNNTIEVHNGGKCCMVYDLISIEEALLSKMMQVFFLHFDKVKVNSKEAMTIRDVFFCKWPSILRFIELLLDGNIALNFTMSEKNSHIEDHGFLWRIEQAHIVDLFHFRVSLEL